MNIGNNVKQLLKSIQGKDCELIVVSKTRTREEIMQAYEAGVRNFGENKVQEMTEKHEDLPRDIRWHMIGHLQRNKVKYIIPFVYMIHSVDSLRLLKEINKQAAKTNRIISCLLQVHIAEEESKFGFSENEIEEMLKSGSIENFKNVRIEGLMGMATFTEDENQIRKEFIGLKNLFEAHQKHEGLENVNLKHLSIGMSNDYAIAVEEKSTMIRVGTAIFGPRNYN